MKKETYVFSCEKICRSYREDRRELWTLTVRAKHLPTTFKYGPNARFATLNNKPAKEMLETLQHDPASFLFKNNGMMVVADSIRATGDEVELVCLEAEPDDALPGHGVLNGGHTYRCLTEAVTNGAKYPEASDKAVVALTVAIGIPDDDVWRISKARNTSEKVPLHALRELAGDWSPLKQYLPERSRQFVAFKPNEAGYEDAEFDPTDLVRRIALMHNKMFPAERGMHPVNAYLSVGTLVRTYKQEDFLDLAPLLPDVLWLEELVVKEWEKANGQRARNSDKLGVITNLSGCSAEHTTLLSGYEAKLTLADPFVLPVMAAFRVFIKDGSWVTPLEELWQQFGRRTIEALWEAYNESGKSSAAYFGRSKSSWAATCDLTKSVALQNGWIKVS
jgi:hypothetical protein